MEASHILCEYKICLEQCVVLQHPQVSTECLDILRRVLVADPTRRISMEEIKTHKWFSRGLPPGALEMNEFLLQGLSTMDDVSSFPTAISQNIVCTFKLEFPPNQIQIHDLFN